MLRDELSLIFGLFNFFDIAKKVHIPKNTDKAIFSINTVVINMFRWVSGAKDFDKDLSTYRIYLINHEVGHYLGWGHTDCPSENALAPVMMQQSKTTDGCIPNGWPIYERVKLLYSSP